MNLMEQLRRNSLAFVSLIVAFSALGYNTWRNELTEHNRTVREAGFAMLIHIGELQRITYLAHYDRDPVAGNPRKGWTEVLVINDLGTLMPVNVRNGSEELNAAWAGSWDKLGTDDSAIAAIDNSMSSLRGEITQTLNSLD